MIIISTFMIIMTYYSIIIKLIEYLVKNIRCLFFHVTLDHHKLIYIPPVLPIQSLCMLN